MVRPYARLPMRRTSPLLAAVLALGAFLGACSQQKDPTVAELREDLVEELRDVQPSITADQAECYAALLVQDKSDVDDFVDVKFSESEPEPEVAERIAAAAVAAREDCDLAEAPR
jgi:hypothetical protein